MENENTLTVGTRESLSITMRYHLLQTNLRIAADPVSKRGIDLLVFRGKPHEYVVRDPVDEK